MFDIRLQFNIIFFITTESHYTVNGVTVLHSVVSIHIPDTFLGGKNTYCFSSLCNLVLLTLICLYV